MREAAEARQPQRQLRQAVVRQAQLPQPHQLAKAHQRVLVQPVRRQVQLGAEGGGQGRRGVAEMT